MKKHVKKGTFLFFRKRKRDRKIEMSPFSPFSGQAMVEYILVAFVLIIAAYGAIEMFRNGLAGYFNKVAKIRSGPAGMEP